MALVNLPEISYSPAGQVDKIYVVLKNDDGYWRGGSSFGTKAQALVVSCTDADSIGAYRPSVADLADLPIGLYEYYGFAAVGASPDITADGEAIGYESVWAWGGQQPTASPGVSGTSIYGAQSDIESVFGIDNVRRWSNLDNADDDVDLSRINLAIAFADGMLETTLQDGPYAVPLAGMSTSSRVVITDVWATLAGLWLYSSRGQKDEEETTRYSKKKRDTESTLRMIKGGILRITAAKRWPVPNCPVSVT